MTKYTKTKVTRQQQIKEKYLEYPGSTMPFSSEDYRDMYYNTLIKEQQKEIAGIENNNWRPM